MQVHSIIQNYKVAYKIKHSSVKNCCRIMIMFVAFTIMLPWQLHLSRRQTNSVVKTLKDAEVTGQPPEKA